MKKIVGENNSIMWHEFMTLFVFWNTFIRKWFWDTLFIRPGDISPYPVSRSSRDNCYRFCQVQSSLNSSGEYPGVHNESRRRIPTKNISHFTGNFWPQVSLKFHFLIPKPINLTGFITFVVRQDFATLKLNYMENFGRGNYITLWRDKDRRWRRVLGQQKSVFWKLFIILLESSSRIDGLRCYRKTSHIPFLLLV